MPQREFEIMSARNGAVELSVKGYKGRACQEAVKLFERIVGELTSQRATSELYEPEEQVRFRIDQRQ